MGLAVEVIKGGALGSAIGAGIELVRDGEFTAGKTFRTSAVAFAALEIVAHVFGCDAATSAISGVWAYASHENGSLNDIARVAGAAILGACSGFLFGGFIGSILSFIMIPKVIPNPLAGE